MNDNVVSAEATFYSQRENIEDHLTDGYPDNREIEVLVKFMFKNLVRLANYAVVEDE